MDGYKKGGLKEKYFIQKRSGSLIDPEAQYFVLRVDRDPHALRALRRYELSVRQDNPEFADDLRRWFRQLKTTVAGERLPETMANALDMYEQQGQRVAEMGEEIDRLRDWLRQAQMEFDSQVHIASTTGETEKTVAMLKESAEAASKAFSAALA